MNSRRSILWWGFALGAVAVLAALAWASVLVHNLERRNDANRADAQRQELIRLALWRLDSQMAPILAMEAARPSVDTFARTASDSTRDERKDTPQRSNLGNAFADGYFVVDESRSVQASDDRTRAVAQRVADESPPADLLTAESAPAAEATQAEVGEEAAQSYDYAARQQITNLAQRAAAPESAEDLASSGMPAMAAAKREVRESDFGGAPASAMLSDGALADDAHPGPEPIEPRWVESGPDGVELVLLRTVWVGEATRSEGVRLDWPGLRSTLEASLGDLLPGSTLLPARGQAASELERRGAAFRLATIPALLVPGDIPAAFPAAMSPVLWALVITWLAAIAALVAVAMVLRATLRLSDRRAKFVGAVTHELRTPLTTFRLYAQMLAGGMVTDEKAKAEYLGTLERESVRLAEIVENVLEYARLTRRRPGGARPPGERSISPSELLARVRPVLSRRAEQSGMDLIVSVEPAAEGSRTVTCDPRSVERILMNLVENACKYAVPPEDQMSDDTDTRIHLDMGRTDRFLEVLVADHGPGIPRRERERVFGEFQRGPEAAGGSRPGLGLGLALSRGLAREMGGDLRLVRRRAHGAEFLLTIPLDPVVGPGAGGVQNG